MRVSAGVAWFARLSLMGLAIYLGSSYLIHHYVDRPVVNSARQPHKIQHAPGQDEKFTAELRSGNEAFGNGQYSDALDDFTLAARAVEELSEDQYTSLRSARLGLAQAYANAQDSRAADGVYRAMADCANQQGGKFLIDKDFDDAIKRAQDAAELESHIAADKREQLQATAYLLSNANIGLARYAEAEQAIQGMIDYLKASAGEDDRGFCDNYLSLSTPYSDAKDWKGAQQALESGVETCDRALQHSSDGSVLSAQMMTSKNWAQYNLIIAKYQAGDTDGALAKAQEFYDEYANWPPNSLRPLSVAYHPPDFAALALQIARETKREDAIAIWQPKAPASITVVSLHPTQNQ